MSQPTIEPEFDPQSQLSPAPQGPSDQIEPVGSAMERRSAPSVKKWGLRLLRWLLQLLILIFVLRAGWGLWTETQLQFQTSDWQVTWNLSALGFSIFFYSLGLFLFGFPWTAALFWLHRPIEDSAIANHKVQWWGWRELQVYVISHLGKYVPGKGMVILIRYELMRPAGYNLGECTVGSFYETLTTMGTAAVIALLLTCFSYLVSPHLSWEILLIGLLGLTLSFAVVLIPPGFQQFSRLLSVPFPESRPRLTRIFPWRLFLLTLVWDALAWSCWGTSYYWLICSLGPVAAPAEVWFASQAAVAAGILAGFLSMLPGQAVVRDLILAEALVPWIGRPHALLAAGLFRLLTLGIEILIGGLLYGNLKYQDWRQAAPKVG